MCKILYVYFLFQQLKDIILIRIEDTKLKIGTKFQIKEKMLVAHDFSALANGKNV